MTADQTAAVIIAAGFLHVMVATAIFIASDDPWSNTPHITFGEAFWWPLLLLKALLIGLWRTLFAGWKL